METHDSFLPEAERLFDSYISSAAENRRFLFTPAERAQYRQWLLDPKWLTVGGTAKERQQQQNI